MMRVEREAYKRDLCGGCKVPLSPKKARSKKMSLGFLKDVFFFRSKGLCVLSPSFFSQKRRKEAKIKIPHTLLRDISY